jgi:high-affinity nickel permease
MDVEWITVMLFGLLLGMKHATDADHVVALTTIVSKKPKFNQAAMVGIIWGLGHTIAIVIMGFIIIYMKVKIPPNLEASFEVGVGIMIILLGVLSLRQLLHKKEYAAVVEEKPAALLHRRDLQSLMVGLVHGLAGSAAVALLVLNTIETINLAVLYLLIFGVGTIAGMMIISSFISLAYIFTKRSTVMYRTLCFSTAAFSIVFGLIYIFPIM